MRGAVLAIAALVLVVAPAAQAQEDDGEALFQANCAACHQAGGVGVPGLFPPLAGNPNVADAEYVGSVIRNGREGEIEVLGQTYNQVMPAIAGLSDAQIDAIIEYIQVDLQAVPAETPDTTVAPAPGAPVEGLALVEAATRGEELFAGRERLANGGPACIACHTAGDLGNLSGPGLGPDLTGVRASLAAPHAGDWAELYTDDPLTEEEQTDLAAFLEVGGEQPSDSFVDGLVVMALGGLVLAVGYAVAVGFDRKQREGGS